MESDGARAGSHIIKRPRLLRLLDQGNTPLILLLAPAGYGKTTLARQWLEHGNRCAAWYSASPASSDVAALAAGLARAIDPILPGAGTRVVERSRVSRNAQLEFQLLAELLAEDLAAWPEDAWLVVDDYQFLIDAPESDQFFEIVAITTPLRALVTSRERPRWATARRVMYGELSEVGRRTLALTRREARRLLARVDSPATEDVIAMADGWPAVLGLASLAAGGRPPTPDVPDELYEYFAQELFARIPAGLQRHLYELALMPRVRSALAARLFGVSSGQILDEATRAGFLTPEGSGSWSLHPLLRAFLIRRFADEAEASRHEVVADVGEVLVRERQWDEAFGLIESERDVELFVEVLESSLAQLVDEGRLATLTRWIEFAHAERVDAPVVDLVEAELTLRAGQYGEAETLATRAARGFNRRSSLLSRAWLVAGRAAHLNNRSSSALAHLECAGRRASTDDDLDEALWLQLVASVEAESAECGAILEHLRAVPSERPEHALRVAMGSASVAALSGNPAAAVETALGARPLADRVTGSMTRSSYLNQTAYFLVVVGRYEEAAELAARCIADAEHERLDFARHHGTSTLAQACLGLRQFSRARDLLAEVLSASARADSYMKYHARALLARLFLAQRQPTAALEMTKDPPDVPVGTVRGEYLATRALALVALGACEEAANDAQAALGETSRFEATTLAAWVRAILSLAASKDDRSEPILTAIDETVRGGHADALVCAYRTHPPLLQVIGDSGRSGPWLAAIVRRARDDVLARQAGLVVSREPSPVSGLTPREREVHGLLSEGLTNREIADRLFISEPTAKVHVRHILEKLGARSRTEAIVLPFRKHES